MTPVRLEPAALRSRVKHSTTEPLRSHICEVMMCSMQGVIKRSLEEFVYFLMKYYTLIDFNEVDMNNYLPEKSNIHRGCKAEMNITY